MRSHALVLAAAGMLAVALPYPSDAFAIDLVVAEPAVGRSEVARLRAHFDSVDAELRQAGELHLTSGQRRARATLIGWLREYRAAGEFPRNDRFERAMPFFRDSQGTLCAMAYLIQRSGRGDIVDRVAATRNNAYIPELADDPALRSWLDSVGLSMAEAARIQPTYTPKIEPAIAEYDSAWNRRDTITVGMLLAPEYQYFTSRGGVSSRAESMAMLSSPEYRLDQAQRSEVQVAFTGPVAIVSSRWAGRGSYRGRPFNDDQRCGQTWLLTEEEQRWQLLSEHCVQIAGRTSEAG